MSQGTTGLQLRKVYLLKGGRKIADKLHITEQGLIFSFYPRKSNDQIANNGPLNLMTAILITLLITFGFAMLLAVSYKPKTGNKPKKSSIPKQPKPRKVLMGPENPQWLKMYTEEMARRNTALTSSVIKKWIAEDSLLELRPDITRY